PDLPSFPTRRSSDLEPQEASVEPFLASKEPLHPDVVMTDHDEKTVSLERGVERPRGTDVADDREALLVRGPAHARAPRPLAGTLHGDRGHPALGSVPRAVLREEAVARLR